MFAASQVQSTSEVESRPSVTRPEPMLSIVRDVQHEARSEASKRSELAAQQYAATRNTRRSVRARLDFASVFHRELHECQVHFGPSHSNANVARGVDESEGTIRKWRTGEKAVPAWALLKLPFEFGRRIRSFMDAAHSGRIERRELPHVRPMLAKLASQIANEDREVALSELIPAQQQLAEIVGVLRSPGCR